MERAAHLPLETFALVTEPCEGLTSALGRDYELRELPYGAMKRAMRAAGALDAAGDALLAASLHVDGTPIGMDRLDALPGHLSTVIQAALVRCLELHGLSTAAAAAPAESPAATGTEASPGEA